MKHVRWISLFATILMSTGCQTLSGIGETLGNSTIIYYTPIMHCGGVYRPDRSVANIPNYIYRIDEIYNGQPVPVTMRRAYFYLSLEDSRSSVRETRRLEQFRNPTDSDDPEGPFVIVAKGGVTNLGWLALPGSHAGRNAFVVERDESGSVTGLTEWYPDLHYDPSLSGELRPFIAIRRGPPSRANDPGPCDVQQVSARVAATPGRR